MWTCVFVVYARVVEIERCENTQMTGVTRVTSYFSGFHFISFPSSSRRVHSTYVISGWLLSFRIFMVRGCASILSMIGFGLRSTWNGKLEKFKWRKNITKEEENKKNSELILIRVRRELRARLIIMQGLSHTSKWRRSNEWWASDDKMNRKTD